MKLDRNIHKDGLGKYALIKLRIDQPVSLQALPDHYRIAKDAVDFGREGTGSDFFVIRLKDKYAAPALAAYAMAAYADDPEFAMEVLNLSKAAAEYPNKQQPS